jgi:hypothetical protein
VKDPTLSTVLEFQVIEGLSKYGSKLGVVEIPALGMRRQEDLARSSRQAWAI